MSDANLIKDKIREELEKGMPSKRKILSYLLDLLKKNKYPSLSDFEFYDIVGYTYKLNLNYKLNLEIFFYPIYDALKKKIKKLYGKEKTLEMEQYLMEKFGLNSPEKNGKNRQKQYSPPSLLTIIKYLFFLLFLIVGITVIFTGIFAYSFLSLYLKGFAFVLIIIGLGFIIGSILILSK